MAQIIKTHPLTNVLHNQVMRAEYMHMAEDARHAGLARVYSYVTAIMAGLAVLLIVTGLVVVVL